MQKFRHLFLLVAPCLLTVLSGCGQQKLISRQGFYFDTYIIASIPASQQAEEILKEAFSLCQQYESQLSRTVEDSEISRLNGANGQPITLSDSTAELLNLALFYCEESGGLFDITIGAVSSLWDFRSGQGTVPEAQAISSALERVDYRNLHLEGNTAWLENGAQVDLGGIAKGYIADQIAAFLQKKGVESGILNFGGNVVAIGAKPDQSPWRVGIQKPFGKAGQYVEMLDVTNRAVVTSGDYQRYFFQEGRCYHHLLNPATGYPADSDLDSATILCENSAEGDALSTICYLMGSQKAIEYLESLEGVEGLLVKKDGSLVCTSGLE